MSLHNRWPKAALGIAAGFLLASQAASADALDEIFRVQQSVHAANRSSQQNIDRLADQTQELLAQYRTEAQQVDSLRVYNTQLQKLVAAQNAERRKLQGEINGVTDVERKIVPLMQRMVTMIEKVVAADVPFLLEERNKRVENLQNLLNRADITVAEKYRKIVEAYTIENSYGQTIESYRDVLVMEGQEEREVDFLRIGRVGLFWLTRDGADCGAWDQESRAWVELPGSYADAIAQGLKVARKQAPPNLLLLPISAAKEVQQ